MPILLDQVSQDSQSESFLWPFDRQHVRTGAIIVQADNFGSEFVQIEASIDQTTWIILEDESGPVSFTQNIIKLLQLPCGLYLRANLTGSDANTKNVTVAIQ